MNEILNAAVTFPTVIFTVLLGFVILYWISVVVGALDIDLFGGDAIEAFDGAIEGAAESAAEAAAEAGAEAAGEMADGADAGDVGDAPGALSGLGLRRVPITVSASLIVLFGWLLSMIGTHFAPFYVSATLSKWVIGPLVLVIAFMIAVILTSFVIRPLIPLFETKTAKSRTDYVGSMCTITTGRVDADFGQAKIEDGGDVLVVDVRCDRDSAGLGRGNRALIIDYDRDRLAYLVEPIEQLLGASGDEEST